MNGKARSSPKLDRASESAALVVVVGGGVNGVRVGTEDGQRVEGASNVLYLFPRQFAGANAQQNSIALIHSCLSFLSGPGAQKRD